MYPVNDSEMEKWTKILKNFEIDYWYRLENERQYCCNIYDIQGLENKVSSRLLLTLFYYGEAVITKFNDKYLVCIPQNKAESIDIDGTWLGGMVSLSPSNINGIKINQKFKPFKVKKENSVYFKWNDLGIAPSLIYGEFINKLILLESNAITNTITSAKTHSQNIQFNSVIEQMKDKMRWLDPTTNVITKIINNPEVYGSSGSIENQMISYRAIENQMPTNVYFENLIAYTKIAYQRLGKRGQTIDKKERVINSEQENSTSVFPVLERETIRNLLEGVNDMNSKFNFSPELQLFVYVPAGEIQDRSTDSPSTGDPSVEENLGGGD